MYIYTQYIFKVPQVMFERNNYTVLEFVSIVEVCIVVLGDFVNGGVVILSTEDGTATGETHTHTLYVCVTQGIVIY